MAMMGRSLILGLPDSRASREPTFILTARTVVEANSVRRRARPRGISYQGRYLLFHLRQIILNGLPKDAKIH